jgi:quinolinate synthase
LETLQTPVTVAPLIAERARLSIDRMLALA